MPAMRNATLKMFQVSVPIKLDARNADIINIVMLMLFAVSFFILIYEYLR